MSEKATASVFPKTKLVPVYIITGNLLISDSVIKRSKKRIFLQKRKNFIYKFEVLFCCWFTYNIENVSGNLNGSNLCPALMFQIFATSL